MLLLSSAKTLQRFAWKYNFLTLYTCIFKFYAVCFWVCDNKRCSKVSYISAQNKSWLYCLLWSLTRSAVKLSLFQDKLRSTTEILRNLDIHKCSQNPCRGMKAQHGRMIPGIPYFTCFKTSKQSPFIQYTTQGEMSDRSSFNNLSESLETYKRPKVILLKRKFIKNIRISDTTPNPVSTSTWLCVTSSM